LALTLPKYLASVGFGFAFTVGWGILGILIVAIGDTGGGAALRSLLKAGFWGCLWKGKMM
jgi:hypothetical protein